MPTGLLASRRRACDRSCATANRFAGRAGELRLRERSRTPLVNTASTAVRARSAKSRSSSSSSIAAAAEPPISRSPTKSTTFAPSSLTFMVQGMIEFSRLDNAQASLWDDALGLRKARSSRRKRPGVANMPSASTEHRPHAEPPPRPIFQAPLSPRATHRPACGAGSFRAQDRATPRT